METAGMEEANTEVENMQDADMQDANIEVMDNRIVKMEINKNSISDSMQILPVTETDAQELLDIYAPYVTDTAVSFEYEVPSPEEFTDRIRSISTAFPYLKAVDEDGKILGYAYAGRFHPRKAYDWSAEMTIYLRQDCRRKGIGKKLYSALEQILKEMGICNLNACIAVPVSEDRYLTMDSVRFHEKMGYQMVGTFHGSGYKFKTWYDMCWMEKIIGDHRPDQPEVKFGK